MSRSGWLLAVALALLPSLGRAESSYDDVLRAALEAKERALETSTPEHWRQAMERFRELDRAEPSKESKYELGFAAMQLGLSDVAFEQFRAALALGITGSAEVKAGAFVSEHAAAMAWLYLEGQAGTRVFIDDEWRADLPLVAPLPVRAREVRLRAEFEGRDPNELRLLLTRGEGTRVTLAPRETRKAPAVLPPARATSGSPEPVPTLTLNLGGAPEPQSHSADWALLIGGAALVTASAVLVPVASTAIHEHRVELTSACFEQSAADVCETPLPGRAGPAQESVDAIATWRTVRTAAWGGLAAGAVLAVWGTLSLTVLSEDDAALFVLPTPRGAQVHATLFFP